MTPYALIVDALALVAMLAGFAVAFRQRRVRALVRRLRGMGPARAAREQGEDPLHYLMIISGTMLMVFGILMFAFTTLYALIT